MTLYDLIAQPPPVPWRVYRRWLAVDGLTVMQVGEKEWARACERWAGMSEERREVELQEVE